ncbi:cation transporting ATPase C-terminal domain-containing protein [Mesoplasma photuris]|uniref:P-type ATPase n=1 Tax=Mesoplasma photuris TaxID=217731 RepID=UPI0004E10FC5|nr:cation transporting ATPase C-terminal domain-containing protein [Mesoplasma photuris]
MFLKKERKIKEKIKKIKNRRTSKWSGHQRTIAYATKSNEQIKKKFNNPSFILDSNFVKKETGKSFSSSKDKWNIFSALKHILSDFFTLLLIGIIVYHFVMFGIEVDMEYLAGGLLVTFLVSLSVVFELINDRSIHENNKKIKLSASTKVKVIRDEPEITNLEEFILAAEELKSDLIGVDTNKIAKGDIVFFKKGDIIPVDCKIIYTNSLIVSQEVLSGDATLINKKDVHSNNSKKLLELENILFRGSVVMDGEAWAMVIHKEKRTLFEHKKQKEVDNKKDTPFNAQTKRVSKILVMTILLFVPLMFIMAFVLEGMKDSTFADPKLYVDALIFAMAIAVALSPDVLPLILSSSFSRTRKKLAKDKIVSRDGSVAQNIGSMDILAVDFNSIFIKSEGNLKNVTNVLGELDETALKHAIMFAENDLIVDDKYTSLFHQIAEYEKLDRSINRKYNFVQNYEIGFNHMKSHIIEDKSGQKYSVLIGNKYDLIDKCNSYKLNNRSIDITKEDRTEIMNIFDDMHSNKIDSLAIAIKPIEGIQQRRILANNYEFVGMINYTVKHKAKAKDVIKDIKKEKVDIKFFTHDSLYDALIIADILKYNVNGSMSKLEIDELTDEQLIKRIENGNLFYNLDSIVETRIIKVLQKFGHTVGFLGKDVNDANQMLIADIGITTNKSDAFGKHCANLLIQDGRIGDIAIAIQESRTSLMNVMKFIKYKITTSISLTIKLLIGLIIINTEPMTPIQLLIQNMLMSAVQFSLIYDKLDSRYREGPVRWDTKSIIPFAIYNILWIQLLMAANVLFLNFVSNPGIIEHIRSGLDTTLDTGTGETIMFQSAYWLDDTIANILFALVMCNHYKFWFRELPSKTTTTVIGVAAIIAFVLPIIPKTEIVFDLHVATPIWFAFIIPTWIIYIFSFDIYKLGYLKWKGKWL